MIQPGNRRAGPYTSGTTFPFGFKVFDAADIVFTKTSAAGVDSILVLGTDYTVALNPDQETSPGGSVTYLSLGAGEMVTITSNMAASQTYDVTNAGGFYPSAMEDALDRAIILVQQLYERIVRTVALPVSSSLANVFLPAPVANRGLKWNSTATGLVNTSTDPDVAGATSAAAAAASAAAAATSAGNASTSETNAGNSATAAATSAANAQSSYLAADKKYLGAKAADPTQDNQGAALATGAWYFNTTAGENRVYSGTSWAAVTGGGGAVSSVYGRTGAVTANSGDYTAAKITNTPAGNIAATDIQSAVNELDTEKVSNSVGNPTPAGTTQGAATLLSAVFNACTPASGATGVRLPAAQVGMVYFVNNTTRTFDLNVYPATGETIQGFSANTAATINLTTTNGGSRMGAIFFCTVAATWQMMRSLTTGSIVPSALGTASAGSSAEVARADHVHALPTILGLGAPDYQPADQTVTFGSQTVLTHGLGATPKFALLTYVCQTAENNYAVGDELWVGGQLSTGAAGENLAWNSTNITVRIGASGVTPINNTGAGVGTFTAANWKFRIRAWK
jgi:hypothetical protein